MKIFTRDQIKKWDEFTMRSDCISSLELMERAANSCTEWFVQNYYDTNSFAIFCGPGNNGGDGFAIARLLYKKGFEVILFADETQEFSENAAINLKNCRNLSGLEILNYENANNFVFKKNTIIIDALFGIGLHRPVEGKVGHLIQLLNNLNRLKVSIDIPSGLRADKIIADQAVVFKADETLSFHSWKKSMLHPEAGIYCGTIHVLDISLDEEFNSLEPSNDLIIDESIIGEIYQPRNEFSHKGTYGKATVVAGSYGKIGASVLATKATLKSGSGLTFILAPNCGYEILQTACPEAMFISGGENDIVDFNFAENSTVGIGPGLGTHSDTENSFLNFLKTCENPLVIDADALNILSKNSDYLKLIPKNSIITPHPKEFARLFGSTENSFARLDLAREKAQELQIFIILKDHHTQVITPDNNVFYNVTGNSGMAKGGSGDVLLGIITSLLAQNYSRENAAVFGVWLHGKAGDFAAEEFSKEAMLPSDLIDQIGNVFKYLNKKVLPKNRKD